MADGWTIAEARQQFAETGLPIDHLDKLIWCLPGFRACGYSKPGEKGGRRYKRYPIGDLQILHGFLAEHGWLDKPASGDTLPSPPCAGTCCHLTWPWRTMPQPPRGVRQRDPSDPPWDGSRPGTCSRCAGPNHERRQMDNLRQVYIPDGIHINGAVVELAVRPDGTITADTRIDGPARS